MMASEKSKLARWENFIDLGAENELETQRDAIQDRVRRAAGEALRALRARRKITPVRVRSGTTGDATSSTTD
jgi:hypothetical protein